MIFLMTRIGERVPIICEVYGKCTGAKYGIVDKHDDSSRITEAGRSGGSLGWHG